MITILHISDLHFVNNAESYSTEEILIREASSRVKDIPLGNKLLIVTGDFHNFSDKNYDRAKVFLNRLVSEMGIEMDQDVFVVPGNHDVGNKNVLQPLLSPDDKDWSIHQDSCLEMLKTGKQDNRYIPERLHMFRPYTKLVNDIGIYNSTDDDYDYPASTHIRCWREKLIILHLNTALIADGKQKDNQKTDTDTAAKTETWEPYKSKKIPAIAIGHNSFYDLNQKDRLSLATSFKLHYISAYLCGDMHKREENPFREKIPIKSGQIITSEWIPNVVAARSIADGNDNYSEVGYCWHQWCEESDAVEIEYRKWTADYLGETRKDGETGSYLMRQKKDEEIDDSLEKLAPNGEKKEEVSPVGIDNKKEPELVSKADDSDNKEVPLKELPEDYQKTSKYERKNNSGTQSEDEKIPVKSSTVEKQKETDGANNGDYDTAHPMKYIKMLAIIVSLLGVIVAIITILNFNLKKNNTLAIQDESSNTVLIGESIDSLVQATESIWKETDSVDYIGPGFSSEYLITLINSGSKSLDYLSDRIYKECPLAIFDPEREDETVAEILYSNAIVVDALISYGANHYYLHYDIEKILDSILVLLQDESLIESSGGTKGLAVAAVALLKYQSIDDKKSTEYLKAAMIALDNINKNCSNQNGGYNENKVSERRLTSDNIWLYYAFQLLYDKTQFVMYLDSAKNAEEYINTMISQDGSYFLAGDNEDMISVETQALAAVIMKNYLGIEKAKKFKRINGGFPKDNRGSSDTMSCECTSLMSIAFRDMGNEADRVSALSAVFTFQKENGGIEEAADNHSPSDSNSIKTSSTAWFVLSCADDDNFFPQELSGHSAGTE